MTGTRAAAALMAFALPALALPATAAGASGSEAAVYAPVITGRPIEFPGDFGSHPDFRTEWWYVTGWLTPRSGSPLGFQITFFRTKPAIGNGNPSAFAPSQLLIAHCAISDPARGRLWQDQRIRRAGFDLAQAAVGDTDIRVDRWVLKRGDNDAYTATIDADGFSLQLNLSPTQRPMLNGQSGVSRKGPAPEAASYYYSLPNLRVEGSISRNGRTDTVGGSAWFDHEWSSDYLAAGATGWDWIGVNLDGGGALMAFRIRGSDGQSLWAGGTLRSADGKTRMLEPAEVRFTAARSWRSPRTGIVYPVAWQVRAGSLQIDLEPLMDDQENDTRLSTGAIYWEGAVKAYDRGRPLGRGYLELTGYGEPLRLR